MLNWICAIEYILIVALLSPLYAIIRCVFHLQILVEYLLITSHRHADGIHAVSVPYFSEIQDEKVNSIHQIKLKSNLLTVSCPHLTKKRALNCYLFVGCCFCCSFFEGDDFWYISKIDDKFELFILINNSVVSFIWFFSNRFNLSTVYTQMYCF